MGAIPKELAAVEQASAYQIEEFLLLRVMGTKPNGCYVVDIDRSLLTVEPPAFVASWHMLPNARCVPEEVSYEHQEVFTVGLRRDEVIVHHAGGELTVAVQELTPDAGEAMRSLAGPGPAGPQLPTGGEAVGYSSAFDLGEAFRDAIAKIPASPIPDWLATYTILDIGAEIGGIAGFNHMVVRVRGG